MLTELAPLSLNRWRMEVRLSWGAHVCTSVVKTPRNKRLRARVGRSRTSRHASLCIGEEERRQALVASLFWKLGVGLAFRSGASS